MLRWRLLLGTLIVAALAGLCWLDHRAPVAGACLFPLAVVVTLLATSEILRLAGSAGLRPLPWVVYAGNLLIVATSWLAPLAARAAETTADSWNIPWDIANRAASDAPLWLLLATGLAVLLAFVGEIIRYDRPGGVTANLAAAILALVYIGFLMGLVVSFRMDHGVVALASLIVVVKLSDVGAYTVGRVAGRHKLAPRLSPGKTVEGALGGLAFACLGSWATFRWIAPPSTLVESQHTVLWGWLAFGLLVGGAGILGDLAESLIKRDVGQKDSSAWMPGFGGVLDLLDSILLAAPVAYVCWAAGIVGR